MYHSKRAELVESDFTGSAIDHDESSFRHAVMRALRITFVAGATTWAIALPIATVAVSRHEAPGSTVASWFALAVYAVSGLLCHQRPERSFHLLAVQLPVCARCVGIYAGAAMAALLFGAGKASTARGKRALPVGMNRIAVSASIVPIGITLVYE
ncbi:MAG: hypothetical protein C5B57_03695, partial [Blastocatellia bacterium]